MLAEARDRAEAFAEHLQGAGRGARLRRAGRGDARARRDPRPRRAAPAPTRCSASRSTRRTRSAARCIQKARELGAAIETQLLFFDLEWNERAGRARRRAARRPGARVRRAPPAQRCAATARTSSPSPRSACSRRPNVTGGSALPAPLHRADLRDRGAACPTATSRARSRRACRGSRTPTASAAGRPPRRSPSALRPGLRTRAFVFNTLLQDKATKDRLRGYPHWLASRNLANEASDESVEALIAAVQGRYDLARRWYSLKARLLGLDRLAYYDRMAPVSRLGRPHPLRRGRGDRARLLPHLLARAGRHGRGVLHGRLHGRPAAARQARRRVLLVHGAVARTRT